MNAGLSKQEKERMGGKLVDPRGMNVKLVWTRNVSTTNVLEEASWREWWKGKVVMRTHLVVLIYTQSDDDPRINYKFGNTVTSKILKNIKWAWTMRLEELLRDSTGPKLFGGFWLLSVTGKIDATYTWFCFPVCETDHHQTPISEVQIERRPNTQLLKLCF